MYCKVCGDNNASYRNGRRGCLCDSCYRTTPKKIGYEEFKKRYFEADADVLLGGRVDERTAREFYEDYRTSNLNFDQYLQQTTEVI